LPDEPLEMTVALDTDIYLDRTWGEIRDNRVLAERNAPLFNQFLARLRYDTGAVIESVSADDYPGQVDETGMVLLSKCRIERSRACEISNLEHSATS
jgi:hypothetical protein